MTQSIEGAFRSADAAIEHLIRTIVREELRQHLGPEADHLINVKSAPMSASKLRALVRSGQLRGFKHGHDTFISASEFRSFIEGRPVSAPAPIRAAATPIDTTRDAADAVRAALGLVPVDPDERRAFELRIAQRRAEGGERAASLRQVEAERVRLQLKSKEDAARRARRAKRTQR